MTWDWLVQRTGKHCSICRMEYPEFQTGIFGRMESALDLFAVSISATVSAAILEKFLLSH